RTPRVCLVQAGAERTRPQRCALRSSNSFRRLPPPSLRQHPAHAERTFYAPRPGQATQELNPTPPRSAQNALGSKNITAATKVGTNADINNFSGEIAPSGKQPFKIANPAGFGAFAITVRPPPVTAP